MENNPTQRETISMTNRLGGWGSVTTPTLSKKSMSESFVITNDLNVELQVQGKQLIKCNISLSVLKAARVCQLLSKSPMLSHTHSTDQYSFIFVTILE